MVWADGHPERTGGGEYHAGFQLPPTNGLVVLAAPREGGLTILDSVFYQGLTPGQSFGGATDGDAVNRVAIDQPRPGTSNVIAVHIYINEWMPGNTTFLRDEADGKYDDWLELYNASPVEVDLSGYYLSDVSTNRGKWRIPDGFSIGPRGHRVVWVDDEPGQTKVGGELHANFSLGRDSESIYLSAPDLTLLDSVTYASLADNQSAGRYPDGSSSVRIFELASPGAANAIPPPPAPDDPGQCYIPGSLVSGGIGLWGAPNSVLSFWLEPGAPPGVVVDRITGAFLWPTRPDQPAGDFEFRVVVCDIRPGAVPLMAVIAVTVQPTLHILGSEFLEPDAMVIQWQGPKCYYARLQHRDSFTTGAWETQAGRWLSQGGVNQLRVPVAKKTGFYRMVYE